MPRFSINVSFMLTDLPFLERFRAAADLGFAAVDIQFPYDHPAEAVAEAAQAAEVEVVLINLPAGDRAAGDLGIAALPGRESEFRDGAARALEYARALGTGRVNVLAGRPPPDADAGRCRAVMAENLTHAAELFAPEVITVMVEPANGRDVPGFFVQTTEAALAVIGLAGRENLKVQLDLYHRQIMQGDLIPALERHLPDIAHIQFADTPGRHQPGTGEINFERVFAAIDALGYEGWAGAEYIPLGALADSLQWFEPWRTRRV
jgi:hydroxypyruvate isomerase